jgi:arylformamidase
VYIDLSWPIIENHWRYPKFHREEISSFERGDLWQITGFNLASHWFSHIDFPRHTGAEFPDSTAFPLSYFNGKAQVVNLVLPQGCADHAYTAEEIEKAVNAGPRAKILLLRTDWGVQMDWKSEDFWDHAPYITPEGLSYIASIYPQTVAFDFPQDYAIRLLKERKVGPEEQPSHTILLRNNILLVEYLANFDKIGSDSCEFICMPLHLEHMDGCPVRAVAKV